MKNEERVKYLANLYCVLIADDATDRVEETVFEEISRDIGAGYFERREAMEMAKNEGLQVQLADRLSQRIRNLEDMLFMAYCDDALAPTEKKLIMEYANSLGISQEQLKMVNEEAKRRYTEHKENRS